MGIRVYEVEFLLRHHDRLNGLVESTKKQIESIQNDGEDDAIYALMTNRNFDGMPASGRIQDKTAKTALSLKGKTAECREAIRELTENMNLIGVVIDKIALAKRRLTMEEQNIINLKYDRSLSPQDIAKMTGFSRNTIKEKTSTTLVKMAATSGITLNEFKEIERMCMRNDY